MVEAVTGVSQIEFTCHVACGMATYVFKDKDDIVPITRFINVKEMMDYLEECSKEVIKRWKKPIIALKLYKKLLKCLERKKSPKNLRIEKMLLDILFSRDYLGKFSYEALLIGCMHFQDGFNFDLERAKRCAIHYALPDGRIVPFCSFNVVHRKEFERTYVQQKERLCAEKHT
jgi:hypothetical protein